MNKPSIDPHDPFDRELDRFLKHRPLSASPTFSARVMETVREENQRARHRSFFRASTLAGMAASIAILFTALVFFLPAPEHSMEPVASEYAEWEEYADILLMNEFLDNAKILLDEESLIALEILAQTN